MLCEKCKKNNASVHYRYNDNGTVTEKHLCSECAKESGLISDSGSVSSGFWNENIFSDVFSKMPFSSSLGSYQIRPDNNERHVCPGCGMTENEFRASGKFGCEMCYSVFNNLVNAMLMKMHMSVEHKGKVPAGRNEALSLKRKIEKLRADMKCAVDNQEYEEAAKIRDIIRALEDGEENGNVKSNGGDCE